MLLRHAVLSLVLGFLASLSWTGPAAAACTVSPSSPSDGSVVTQSPGFTWTGDCVRYRVMFSPSGTFGADRVTTAWQARRVYRMGEPIWDGYQSGTWSEGVSWRVQGRSGDGTVSVTPSWRVEMDPDLDDDGWSQGEGDCDDGDVGVYPGAPESCDGVDEDCDGTADDGLAFATWWWDADGDGYGAAGTEVSTCDGAPAGYVSVSGDCAALDAGVHPGAPETCDGVDEDCDGTADDGLAFVEYYLDLDGDGYGQAEWAELSCGGVPEGYAVEAGDCDEGDAGVHPAAVDVCDGVDQDCDGVVDEDAAYVPYYPDADGDGYGETALEALSCGGAPAGYVALPGDCDEGDVTVNPGHAEECDGLDNDCDGEAEEGLAFETYYADGDGDGWGFTAFGYESCDGPLPGYVSQGGDCDEGDPERSPGEAEVCDGLDQDCDGEADEGLVFETWYADVDGDGHGDPAHASTTCDGAPTGYVSAGTDCDDARADASPDGTESCDGADEDCDGEADEGLVFETWYLDLDGDGYGADGVSETTCDGAPSGYVSASGDCDESDATANPGAVEACDGLDQDCDGEADEGFDLVSWYLDFDGDGYGTEGFRTDTCGESPGVGWVSEGGDCDEGDATVGPGATEACDDGVDSDCDGSTADCDRDGDGYASDGGDCDDTAPGVHPGAAEACDGVDQDCDGEVDEGLDADGDGHTTCAGDCDDASATAHPGATEACDGVDQDCSGVVDDVSVWDTASLSCAAATFRGEAGGGAGASVNFVGDLNGDGFPDLAIGAPSDATSDSEAGAVYLVYGPVSPGAWTLSGADAKILGEGYRDQFGKSVSGVGDMDGDGNDDLLIGAPGGSNLVGDTGAAFLVRGPVYGTAVVTALSSARLDGAQHEDSFGYDVSAGGDVNGDGIPGLAVSARGYPAGAGYGAVYVFHGPVSGPLTAAGADASVLGTTSMGFGVSVATDGDTDGDGLDDVLIGANGNDDNGENAGAIYVFRGGLTGALSPADADGVLRGEAAGDNAGYREDGLAFAGDVDGDGRDEVLVGAWWNDGGGTDSGAAYLVRGPATGTVELADTVRLIGESSLDYAGFAVRSAGDVDGDGLADVLVGVFQEDGDGPGVAYLLLGPVSAYDEDTLDLSSADALFTGEVMSDHAGYALAGGADVDGDGYDDVLVGASSNDAGGTDAGAAYLLYGGPR